MTAITAGLGEAKKLDPVSKEETIVFKVETEGDNILALAEEAGFCMWGNESHKPEGATIDWSCNYDEELVKFAELIVRECAKIADVADENKCEWLGGNILARFGVKE